MRKISFLIMMCFCDCSSDLKWLIKIFEQKMQVFYMWLTKRGKELYLSLNKSFIEKASKIKDKSECLELLNN